MGYAELAYQVAKKEHFGQVDKAGVDYINHPIAVASMVNGDTEKTVALLHDVVEDTKTTLMNLADLGFPVEIIQAVDAMSKRAGEDYDVYIKRLCENELAIKVKLADMQHNSDISRFKNPSQADIDRCLGYEVKRNKLLSKQKK